MSQKKAVTNKQALAYKRGSKTEKSRILDQIVELTGWHRDHARASLRNCGTIRPAVPRKKRPPVYTDQIINSLIVAWIICRQPSGKRLAPMLPKVIPMLRRDGELNCDDDQADLLCSISAATIDRRLAAERIKRGFRGKSHTKPGTLLKSQIPIRTWADWDDVKPGFIEIDLVGHEGGNSTGEFCFTLTATDIATGWTINRSVKNKAQCWVQQALEHVIERFPFPILGIDSDNGSEFINHHLYEYCIENKITFTRSRPGNKNDGCHVEQKNWTHVRELVGYLRFDTEEELELLNEIWEIDQDFTNYLLANQKLVFKQRQGAKTVKRYDSAKTPCERTLADKSIQESSKDKLRKQLESTHPGELSRQITRLTGQLEKLALFKAPAPIKPRVNRSFNSSVHPEILGEATNQVSRRI